MFTLSVLAALSSVPAQNSPPSPKPKPYRLPGVSLKERIIWDAQCREPEGKGLAFGGQDQEAGEPSGLTRIWRNGGWELIGEGKAIRATPLLEAETKKLAEAVKRKRREYFQGKEIGKDDRREMRVLLEAITQLKPDKRRTISVLELMDRLENELKPDRPISPRLSLEDLLKRLEVIQDRSASIPAPRALAAIAYDSKSGLYVMFGGDHLDYLMNDTWVFDPKRNKWEQRLPESSAPPPRANHKLIAKGDGTITLKGGYTYANNTDYMGGQYIDLADGDWTYDLSANTWKGNGKGVPSCTRVYRSGPFHPSYFIKGPKPDPEAFAKWLEKLPANQWTKTNPPHLPQMNRDWGTAVLDADHDLILRFSGGHCAHSGTDVLHYHLDTNRWELTFPVEFPLGQTYTNTEYPEGVNFNRRPWVTGHTYQNYAYDPSRHLMVFAGRHEFSYFYDPQLGDWTANREPKPKGMTYNSCFYTLTLASTPKPVGVYCWTQEGKLFRSDDASKFRFVEVPLKGERLPGSVVDNSTMAYDSKRGRLLFFRKGYGDKNNYDGQIHEVACKTGQVSKLSPEGCAEAAAIPYLCQIRYDETNDLFLAGATLPPDADGFRRTPAYECKGNRWVSLKIAGDDPNGKVGRNVSLGMIYDAKCKLFWAVDTKSQVFVLRLEVKAADLKPLK